MQKIIADTKPDIIHVHNYTYHLSNSILSVLRKVAVPVVITLHDFSLISPTHRVTKGGILEKCINKQYYKCFTERWIRHSYAQSFVGMIVAYAQMFFRVHERTFDAAIAPSMFLKKQYERAHFPVPITHIFNSVDLDHLPIDKNNRHGAFFFGWFTKEKGMHTLLEAARLLPKIRFRLIGEGPLVPISKEHKKEGRTGENVQDTEVSQNVEVLGRLPNKQVLEVIASSQVLVLPSTIAENNPLVLLEALALGTPVVGTNIGGIPELVHECGELVPVEDPQALKNALEKIISRPDIAKLYGQNGRNFAKTHLSHQTYYKKLMALYYEIAPACLREK